MKYDIIYKLNVDVTSSAITKVTLLHNILSCSNNNGTDANTSKTFVNTMFDINVSWSPLSYQLSLNNTITSNIEQVDDQMYQLVFDKFLYYY